jgi:hypothetical protein
MFNARIWARRRIFRPDEAGCSGGGQPCGPRNRGKPTLRRPYCLRGAGYALRPCSPPRGSGAPKGAKFECTPCGVARHKATRLAFRRSTAAFLGPRAALFVAALPPRPSAKVLAAGPSAGGRAPGAARVRACEARPRAPHPAPSAERLRKTPLSEQDKGRIAGPRNIVKVGVKKSASVRTKSVPRPMDHATRAPFVARAALILLRHKNADAVIDTRAAIF